jgi:hypothetical protein
VNSRVLVNCFVDDGDRGLGEYRGGGRDDVELVLPDFLEG